MQRKILIVGLVLVALVLSACAVQPGGLAVPGAQDAPRPEGAKIVFWVAIVIAILSFIISAVRKA